MLAQVLPAGLFGFFLVFSRIGSAFVFMPGFGEGFVPPRVRLIFALAVTLLVTPVVADKLPAMPESALSMTVIILGETVIGLFFGLSARLVMTAVQSAGTIIALETGFASALVNDPSTQQQSAVLGNFLFVFAILLLLISDLHHLALRGVAESYVAFQPGAPPMMGDMAESMSHLVSRSFELAMEMAAPFVVVGIILNLGLGLLSRLMPQVQIFFIALPLQILLGFVVLVLSISGILLWFLDRYRAIVGDILL